MNVRIVGLSLIVLSIGMIANAYAHTMEVVGDYKIEIGWETEPPRVGHDNAITLEVGIASDFDKAKAEAEDAAMEGMDNMTEAGHDHTMTTTEEGGTAEQEHQMALDLEKQGKYADAAEHHHMAATALEKAGNYADAAEHHHLAATDLENAGDYAGAAEHHNMAAADLDKAGKHTEAIDHEHMATKDLAMVGTSNDHEEEQHDMSTERGLLDNFTVDVTLGDTTTPLKLVEDSKFPGVYHADFTPSVEGFPVVHVVGKLAGEDVDIPFHPEAVEGLSTLSPLKQVKEGTSPKDVDCKVDYVLLLKIANGSPVCVKPATAEKLVEMSWATKA